MKRIGTVLFLAFSLFTYTAHAQITRTMSRSIVKAGNVPTTTVATPIANASHPTASASMDEHPLAVIKGDIISYLQDTTGGLWRLLDPLNNLPNTPNQNGDSLDLSKSVDEFGPINLSNGASFDDTLYKRVLALRVSTPTDITSPKLDSASITFLPEAFDPRDVIQFWAVPIVDDTTQSGDILPFIDLFSSTHNGTPYATGTISASALTLGQLNTLTVKFSHKPMYVGSKVIPHFAICVFDDGPGFFNDSLYFQMDFSPDQTASIDTDGSNSGVPMRTYFAVLDGGTDYVDPASNQPEFITNNVSGFLTGIYTADQNGNFLGNLVLTTYMDGTATAGVSSTDPTANHLSENYPNPVSSTSTINYNLAQSGPVSLVVYNALGEQVATVVNGMQGAGEHSVTFNAGMLPNGAYCYKLQSGDFTATRTMIINR